MGGSHEAFREIHRRRIEGVRAASPHHRHDRSARTPDARRSPVRPLSCRAPDGEARGREGPGDRLAIPASMAINDWVDVETIKALSKHTSAAVVAVLGFSL